MTLRGVILFHPLPKIKSIERANAKITIRWDGPSSTLWDEINQVEVQAHSYTIERATSLGGQFVKAGEATTNRELTIEQILDKVADICVEVLSPTNTKKEMERKRREYFAAGASLVWIVDPVIRTVAVFTSPDESNVLDESQVLDAGAVLPGFTLRIADWFARAGRRTAP